MNLKLLLGLALVLSGGLFGCSTAAKHADEGLPLKRNTANELVPIFDLATPVANAPDYAFLTNAIIDDDPPACPDLQFQDAYRLDLGLRTGPVLMVEFTQGDTRPRSRWLSFFAGNMSQGYRLILPKLNLFFGKYQPYSQPSSTNVIYVSDVGGDGRQELLMFQNNGAGEQLQVCEKYDPTLGIFEDFYVPDKSVPATPSWGQSVLPLSPEAYRQLRSQGPVPLNAIGQHDIYDVRPAEKHVYRPGGKSLRQLAVEQQAARDNPVIPPSAYGTQVLDYSNADSPVADGVVVTDLGGGMMIHSAADSWPALVQQVKPTFAWNGCDLMWIEKDTNGQPHFVLDEAYIYQPTNQPRQWVLLRNDSSKWGQPDLRPEAPRFFYSTLSWFAVATLQKTVPHSDHGDNYAVAISANRKFGTVYEIGWQREMSVGTGHAEYGRRIYVLKDRANQWHFLGEGPEAGWERGGGETVESRVVWSAISTNQLPLQIRFHCEETTTPYNFDADDTNPPPDVTICSECMLAGCFPAQCQDIGKNPYLVAEKNDTLEKIISRLNYYWPGDQDWPDEAERRAKINRAIEAWRAAIVRLNPDLPQQGIIKAGTRVDIVNPGELENHLIELERQRDASKKS